MYTYTFGYRAGKHMAIINIHADSEDEAWDIVDNMNLPNPQLLYKKEM